MNDSRKAQITQRIKALAADVRAGHSRRFEDSEPNGQEHAGHEDSGLTVRCSELSGLTYYGSR